MPELNDWTRFALLVVVIAVVVVAVVVIVSLPLRILGRRRGWDPRTTRRIRRPFAVLLFLVALTVLGVVALPAELEPWRAVLGHAAKIAVIVASAWLAAGLSSFVFARLLDRYRVDVADNRVARRVHTQVIILRRVAAVVIIVVTVGAILLTFPGVEAVGASLLASAGLASVVAGLAAQSTLANVVAGVQLAFSDAIRVDDVVIAEGEWGRIEEITLTYIVVHIWDDRRLVLPSTYFTTTPFQNWTRRGSELLGSVELDVDWTVSPAAMRAKLERVLDADPLWDRRRFVLQVTDATGGMVRVRALVTAASAGALWDLRCNVREALVEWLHEEHPGALPRSRVVLTEPEAAPRRRKREPEPHEGVFSGSAEGERRGQSFTGSVPVTRAGTADPIPG